MILACRRSYRLEHELAEVIGTIYNARSLRRILIEPCCGSIQGSASYQQDEWLPHEGPCFGSIPASSGAFACCADEVVQPCCPA